MRVFLRCEAQPESSHQVPYNLRYRLVRAYQCVRQPHVGENPQARFERRLDGNGLVANTPIPRHNLPMTTSVSIPDPHHAVLPKLAADEEFAAARQVFRSCGYDEPGVIARLEIEEIARFKSIRQGRRTALDIRGPIDVLIRLFLDGEIVQEAAARSLLPEAAIESLAALNLGGACARPPSRLALHRPHLSRIRPLDDVRPCAGAESFERPASA